MLANGGKWLPLQTGEMLKTGAVVKTGAKSRAERKPKSITLSLSGSSKPVARWTGRSSITPPISSSVR